MHACGKGLNRDIATVGNVILVSLPPSVVKFIELGDDKRDFRPTTKEEVIQQLVEATRRRIGSIVGSAEQNKVNVIS